MGPLSQGLLAPALLSALEKGEAHVWYLYPDTFSPELEGDAHALLNDDERARYRRFTFARVRREYLLTRVLARTTLSRYVEVEPSAWRFTLGPHGKPEIEAGQAETRLRFNLSNTTGLIACLVAIDRDVGIDVEWTRRRGETVQIADRFFSTEETAALHALPETEQRERFFDFWTLKEAYIKARGMGLALPLDQFTFHMPGHMAGSKPTVSFDPRMKEDPARWQFECVRPSAEHRMATAIFLPGAALGLRVVERTALFSRGLGT